jgi:hypothetical protein
MYFPAKIAQNFDITNKNDNIFKILPFSWQIAGFLLILQAVSE